MKSLVAFLALLCLPAAVSGQEVDDLQTTFRAVARHWASSNASGLVRHLDPAGVSIDVGDGPMGPLSDRQASALLRQLFDQGETVNVEAGMLERVGGRPPRGFGAISWTTRPRGTEVPVRRTVYFGLEWIENAWRVSEIRLIR
jgi:hypothetical protein